ncbi:MAG: CZB domain-containing protein [Sulfurimonas sp.]
MNTKEKNMYRLYKARTSHLKWVNNIKLLVSGFSIDKKQLTPIAQDSDFGEWFYNEAKQFAQFNSKNVLDEMEILLDEMYNIFTKIYSIYFAKEKGSLKTFLGFKDTASKFEVEFATRCYEDIVVLSDKFKNRFGVLERQLLALGDAKHEMVKVFESEEEMLARKSTPVDEISDNYYHGPRSH